MTVDIVTRSKTIAQALDLDEDKTMQLEGLLHQHFQEALNEAGLDWMQKFEPVFRGTFKDFAPPIVERISKRNRFRKEDYDNDVCDG